MNIGRAQTQFALSFFQEKCARIFFLESAYDIRSAVGGTVVDDQDVEILIQGKNSFQNGGYILLLIIGWYDGYLFQLNLWFCLFSAWSC